MARLIFLLLVTLGLAGLSKSGVAASEDRTTSSWWLDRAREYAIKAKADDPWEVWFAIAVAHAREGRFEEAHSAVRRIQDPEMQEGVLKMVPSEFARFGDEDTAIRFAETIEDDAQQAVALYGAAVLLAKRHDITGAQKATRLVIDPVLASAAWDKIARAQAEEGQYDAALESSAKVLTETDEQKQRKAKLLAFIAEAKASGRKRQAPKRNGTLAEEFRAVARLFADVKIDTNNLDEIRARAAKTQGAGNRASVWRQIAWLCYEANQPAESREALATATGYAEKISDSYQRSLNYILNADLMIELRDVQEARKLVEKARTAERDLGIFRGLASFTTGPVTIGVLVRSGEIDAAFELAESRGGDGSGSIWRALGAACTVVGKKDEVERRLDIIDSESVKAYLCLGVAHGLRKAR